MPKTYITIILLLSCCTAAEADTIRVGKVPYPDVTVVNTQKGRIYFLVPPGRKVDKPLATITFISIKRQDELNRAEKLREQGKFDLAVEAYDAALRDAPKHLAGLIRYRRLAALDKAGEISRATEDWLEIVEQSQAAAATLKLRPTKLAPKGSQLNAQAIALLEAKLKRVKSTIIPPILIDGRLVEDVRTPRSIAHADAINTLLLELYQREGLSKQAGRLAERIVSVGQQKAPPGEGPTKRDEHAAKRLNALEVLVSQGQADRVLK